MPTLANPKWEKYAQGRANGLKQVDAYEAAGYARSPSAASQVEARVEVQNRIAELIAEKQAAGIDAADDIDNLPSELNRDWLIKTLMKNVQLAQHGNQITAANKAVEMLAEIIGVSTKPGKNKGGGSDDDDDEQKGEEFDLNRMADNIGKLGDVLAEKERRAIEKGEEPEAEEKSE